jgi:hydroxymethylglutaryl-CoA lyase
MSAMNPAVPYPDTVALCEVGPRDGFQFESKLIPTERKVAWIRALAGAGLPRIQATSFVHPKMVPQMADAEDVIAALLDLHAEGAAPGAAPISALALNTRGVERAAAAGLRYVDLSIATNETHSRDNANMTVAEGVEEATAMIALALEAGLQPQLGLQTVFGYGQTGDTPLDLVTDLAARFCAAGIESLSLADTTGMANPKLIISTLDAIAHVSNGVPIVLHLHDTRGLGLSNVAVALQAGVDRFDTSVGGLGGCPFIPGATGNVATEDVVYLLESMGVATGVDGAAVSTVARELELFLGRDLPGRLHGLSAKTVPATQTEGL